MPKTFFLILLVASGSLAQREPNSWNGIQPLHSTKTDVEKKLGKPMEGSWNLYDTDNERVMVWYSDGPCDMTGKNLWNVAKETVLGFLVSPKNSVLVQPLISSFGQKFDRAVDPEMNDRFFYVNEDGSIGIDTRRVSSGQEEVMFTAYKPTRADLALKCPNSK